MTLDPADDSDLCPLCGELQARHTVQEWVDHGREAEEKRDALKAALEQAVDDRRDARGPP